jgi:hypothetical protein
MTYTTYREHLTMLLHLHGIKVELEMPEEGQYLTPWIYRSIFDFISSLTGAGQLEPPTEVVTLDAGEVRARRRRCDVRDDDDATRDDDADCIDRLVCVAALASLRRLLARQAYLIGMLVWLLPNRRHVCVIEHANEPYALPADVDALLAAAPLHAPSLHRFHREQPYADHRQPMTVRATLAGLTGDVEFMVDEHTTFPHMVYLVKKQLHIDQSRCIVVFRINAVSVNAVGVTAAMIHAGDHLEFVEMIMMPNEPDVYQLLLERVVLAAFIELINVDE